MNPLNVQNPLNIGTVPEPPTPFDATKTGIALNTIKGLPGAFADTILHPLAQSIGSVGQTFLNATGLNKNTTAITPAGPQDAFFKFLYGDVPKVKDVTTRIAEAEQSIIDSPFAQKYGLDQHALPLAFGGIMGETALDLTGFSGSESKAVRTLAKETDLESVVAHLLNMGVEETIARKVAPDIAATTNTKEVKDILKIVKSQNGLAQIAERTATKDVTPGAASVVPGEASITGAAPLTKAFDWSLPLEERSYGALNTVYRDLQDHLGIEKTLVEDLPKTMTGKQALAEITRVAPLGQQQEFLGQAAEKIQQAGYDTFARTTSTKPPETLPSASTDIGVQDRNKVIEFQIVPGPKKQVEELLQAHSNLADSVLQKPMSRPQPKVSNKSISYEESITKTLPNKKTAKEAFLKGDQEMASLQHMYEQSANRILPGERTSIVPKKVYEDITAGLENYHDITGFQGQARDVFRTFRAFFGKNFDKVKEQILDPFDNAKGAYIDTQKTELDVLKRDIVDKLGIKQGSKMSAAVMDYGEKTIGKEDLIQKFKPAEVEKILEAEKWFRGKYDDLLLKVNAARKEIYGDVRGKKKMLDEEISILEKQLAKKEQQLAGKKRPDTLVFARLKRQVQRLEDAKLKRVDLLNSDSWWRGKLIEKRADYFHHFKDLEGLSGLKNIFETPTGISPSLSGISEYTKPKSKFLGFAQVRLGLKTEHDAVGGLLHYIPSYAYAVHIDPQIPKFRKLAEELAAKSEEAGTKNANNMIEFLQDYANDLAGKTNPADRYIQKLIPGGRKSLAVINWLNSRVKANTILGNLSSSVAQFFNVPQGVASAKLYSVPGVTRTLASIFVDNAPMEASTFIKERYSTSMYDKFDESMLAKPKKFAIWLTGVLDEVGTKFIWNSHYAKAIATKEADPISFADNATRSLVGGRGVGEVPLVHKSKLFQIIAPFQLEVGNLWYVMGDMTTKKDFAGLATLFVANFLMNRAAVEIRGTPVTFDPINALYEGFKEFENDKNPVRGSTKFAGRLAGEVFSNIPGGQTMAELYPEYGFSSLGKANLTRQQLFGAANPSRFGGGLLVTKGLQDPLFKIVPPLAGAQLEKTLAGISAYEKGKDTTPTGKTRFKIKKTPENLIRSMLFGKSSLPAAQAYYKKKNNPLNVTPVGNPLNQ